MSRKTKFVHEAYHVKTLPQTKIISENNFTYKVILKKINKHLKPKVKILDIGCGAGTLDFYLANKGYNITGVDISDKAIDSCIKTAKSLNFNNVKFLQVDFPQNVPDGKFDFILFSEVIEHLENDSLAIQKIYYLLNKGGIVFLSTPSINAPLYKIGLAKNFDRRVGHLRRYKKTDLINLLREKNFRILSSSIEEGPIRNYLFINSIAGKSIRFIKFFLVDVVLFIDLLSAKLFGGSDIIIVARKV